MGEGLGCWGESADRKQWERCEQNKLAPNQPQKVEKEVEGKLAQRNKKCSLHSHESLLACTRESWTCLS